MARVSARGDKRSLSRLERAPGGLSGGVWAAGRSGWMCRWQGSVWRGVGHRVRCNAARMNHSDTRPAAAAAVVWSGLVRVSRWSLSVLTCFLNRSLLSGLNLRFRGPSSSEAAITVPCPGAGERASGFSCEWSVSMISSDNGAWLTPGDAAARVGP